MEGTKGRVDGGAGYPSLRHRRWTPQQGLVKGVRVEISGAVPRKAPEILPGP